MTILMCRNM